MKRQFVDVAIDPSTSFNKVHGQENVENFLLENYKEFTDLEDNVDKILFLSPNDEAHLLDKYNLIGAIKLKYEDIFRDKDLMQNNSNLFYLQFMVESGMLILLSNEKLEEIHLNIPSQTEDVPMLMEAQENYNNDILLDEPCPRSANSTPFPSPSKSTYRRSPIKFSYGKLNFKDYFNAAMSVMRLFLITSANVIRNIQEPMPVDDLTIPPIRERTSRNTSTVLYDADLLEESPPKKRKKGTKKSPKVKRRLSNQDRKTEVLIRQVSALDLYECYKCSENVLDFFIFFMDTMHTIHGKTKMTLPDVFENVYYWVINLLHPDTVRFVLLQSDPHLSREVLNKPATSFLQSKNFVCLKNYCLNESLYIDDTREGSLARFALFMKTVLDMFHIHNEIGQRMDILLPRKLLEFGHYKYRDTIVFSSLYRYVRLNDQASQLTNENDQFLPEVLLPRSCGMDVEEPCPDSPVMQPQHL